MWGVLIQGVYLGGGREGEKDSSGEKRGRLPIFSHLCEDLPTTLPPGDLWGPARMPLPPPPGKQPRAYFEAHSAGIMDDRSMNLQQVVKDFFDNSDLWPCWP